MINKTHVNSKNDLVIFHENFYNKLKKLLQRNTCWEYKE